MQQATLPLSYQAYILQYFPIFLYFRVPFPRLFVQGTYVCRRQVGDINLLRQLYLRFSVAHSASRFIKEADIGLDCDFLLMSDYPPFVPVRGAEIINICCSREFRLCVTRNATSNYSRPNSEPRLVSRFQS